MACPDEDTLLRYLGQQGSDPSASIEAHLETCATCRQVLAVLARDSADGRSTGQDSVSAWASDFLPAGVRIGRYLVQGRLGAGAMGVVYRAIDPELQRPVAIKQLRAAVAGDEDRRARLLREARSLARIVDPNVVSVYDAGIHDGHAFIVMALIEGTTLRGWLEGEPRGHAAVLAAMAQVGAGMCAVHAAGLVHRDLKPDNVLVTADARVLVTDFGLVGLGLSVITSPQLDVEVVDDPRLTATGDLVGTPRYMAPEQLAGDTVGPLADQFALCVMLFEALTGRRPFVGDTPRELLAAIRARAIDPAIEGLPQRLRTLLRRGLDPDPAQRHASMHALVDALARAGARPRGVLVALGATASVLALGAVALWPGPHEVTPIESVAAAEPADMGVEDGAAALASGRQHLAADELAEATTALEAAYAQATVAGAWANAADAATLLVVVLGDHAEDRAGGLRWHRHAAAALERLGEDRMRRAELVDALGRVHIAAGEFELARADFVEAEASYRAELGADDPRAATVLSHLATAEEHLGQTDVALANHRAALEHLDATLHRTERAQALVGLANAYLATGKVEQARDTLIEARDLLTPDDGQLLGRVASNLANALTRLGDYEGAARELDAAEALLVRTYGAEHPNVASVIVGRATLRAISGDLGGAQAGFERALAIKERRFGLDHPSLLPILTDLAHVARVTGDKPTIRRYQLRAVELAEAAYGPEHVALAAALEDLGNTFASADESEAATTVLERARAIRLKHVAADDPSLSVNWLAQAKVYITEKDWPAVDAALARALELAPSPAYRGAVVLTQAESLWRRGDERAAFASARRARELVDGQPGQEGLLAAVDDWLAKH